MLKPINPLIRYEKQLVYVYVLGIIVLFSKSKSKWPKSIEPSVQPEFGEHRQN